MKLKTLKDIKVHGEIVDREWVYIDKLLEEAIKWVKEDLEVMNLTNDFGDTIWKPINITMEWMRRLNITEEDLK